MILRLAVVDRRSKIYDLDLVIIFVFFKQNVLWLEVSVHYLVTVAIMDALEQSLHYDGGVILRKMLPCCDLFKKLSSKANICYYVVPLFALVGLVHLQNIWVVQLLKVYYFAFEHLFFEFVHTCLPQYFHRTFNLILFVDTLSDLTEGPLPQ